MKSCPDCGGQLEQRVIDHIATWGQRRVLIRHVPALVCNACDQVLFTPDVTHRIQTLARAEQQPGEPIILVPVRDFDEQAAAAHA